MADVKADMAAVTVPPVTKGTALSVDLCCKYDHRVRILQPHRQHLTTQQKEPQASVGELRMA